MLAKLFSLLFILMPVCLVQAQDSADYTNSFGGVDSYQDSSKIAKTDAQDARNVLTDNGKLTKRPGSVAIATVLNGYSISAIGEYVSPSNIRYLIAQASTTVYASDLGVTGFVAIATVTAGYPLDFTPAFGKVYFTNGIDTPFSWDGTTTVWVPTIPKCAHIEFADERIYCSNVPNFRSTTYASRYGDATDYTIPAVSPLPADAPNSFTFNRNDGDQINCMKVTPWGKFIGKKNSSYILKGQDNDHYYKQIVSPTVGCLDDRSVQMVDGELVWLGQDYTIYSWSGNEAPKPASREIDSYVKSIRQATSQQNNYNTSTLYDWRAGTVTWNGSKPGLDMETVAWAGSVHPSTWSHIDISSTDWSAVGSVLTNVSTTQIIGALTLTQTPGSHLLDNFTDGNYTNNPTWTFGSGTNYFSIINAELSYRNYSGNGYSTGYLYAQSLPAYGAWSFSAVGYPLDDALYGIAETIFISSSAVLANTSGYSLEVNGQDRLVYLNKYTAGTKLRLCTIASPTTYGGTISIVRDQATGTFTISVEGNAPTTYTDNTFTTSAFMLLVGTVYASAGRDISAGWDNIYIPNAYNTSGTFLSPIFDTGFLAPVGGVFEYNANSVVGTTVTFQVREALTNSVDAMGAWINVPEGASGTWRLPLTKRYWQYQANLSAPSGSTTPILYKSVLTAVSTGTYYSKPQYIGTSITSWDLFAVDQQVSNIALSAFSVRSAYAPFGILDPLPAWTPQANGTVLTISTGAYVQFKFELTPVTSTDTLQVDGINIAWHEGEGKPLASLYDDHRYILCANTTPGTNINDLCLVWQKNKKWIPFSGQSWSALTRFNSYPVAGDGTNASKVWKILDTTYLNDDGTPISAYWITKDFDYDKPNQIKVPMKLWLEADNLPTSFLTIGFAPDKGSTWTSSTIDLAQSAYLNTNVSDIFDGFALGKYFKFKFSDNTLNSTFKLNAFSVYYDSKPLGQE